MKQPKYANAFTITHNADLGEFVVNFLHQYPAVPDEETMDKGMSRTKTLTQKKNVCGVVLPTDVANQLADIIKESLAEVQDHE